MKIFIHYSNDRDTLDVVALFSTLAAAEASVVEQHGCLVQDSIASMELDRPDTLEYLV